MIPDYVLTFELKRGHLKAPPFIIQSDSDIFIDSYSKETVMQLEHPIVLFQTEPAQAGSYAGPV